MNHEGSDPQVSVGIVAFNTAVDILSQTILSIRNSTVSAEIMLLCNSPNATYQQAVIELGQRYECRVFGDQPNRGFGHAHNYLAKNTTTAWYACCNPDIELHPECLEQLLSATIRSGQFGLLAPTLIDEFGQVQAVNRPFLTPFSLLRRCFHIQEGLLSNTCDTTGLIRAEFISGAFFLVSKETWQALGGFDERFFLYCEDADLSIRAAEIGVNYIHPSAKAIHRWHRASRRSPRALMYHIYSLLRYFAKHHCRLRFTK
jgi:hypothetical protein